MRKHDDKHALCYIVNEDYPEGYIQTDALVTDGGRGLGNSLHFSRKTNADPEHRWLCIVVDAKNHVLTHAHAPTKAKADQRARDNLDAMGLPKRGYDTGSYHTAA